MPLLVKSHTSRLTCTNLQWTIAEAGSNINNFAGTKYVTKVYFGLTIALEIYSKSFFGNMDVKYMRKYTYKQE